MEEYGETEGIKAGEELGVVELFYPLLIESSNDAASVLSHFIGEERFITLMNEKAKSILMKETNFSDVSGYDPGNEATAKDLFYLARYISNNRPPIWEITKGNPVRVFGETKFDIGGLWNKNIFVEDPTFIGGKTGFIKTSKHTAIFLFKFQKPLEEEQNIVIILLGSDNRRADTQKIYLWLREHYFN